MDPMSRFIRDREVLEFGNEPEIKKIVVVRKTPLKPRKHQPEKPRRRVHQFVPKFNVGDTYNFTTVDEQGRNPTTSVNSELTLSFPSSDPERKCTEKPEMVERMKSGFKLSDKPKIPDVYYDSCVFSSSNCVENECDLTDGPNSLGVAVSDNGDKKQTNLLNSCHLEPTNLQGFDNKERSSLLYHNSLHHCTLEKRQREVVKIQIPLEIAECAVNIVYSETSKGFLLDHGLRKPVFLVMDLILVELAKYDLLHEDWYTQENSSSSIETSQQKMVKIEIPLDIAKNVVKICFSESSKGLLLDSSLKRPLFLVMNLILDEVAKYNRNEMSTLENSSKSIEIRRREVVKIEISFEMAKCMANIFKSESSMEVLIDCGLLKRPVFLVMEVITDEVTKCMFLDGDRCVSSSTKTKQSEMVEIEIPLVIAECAVNIFYSEFTKWILLDPDLNRPILEVMHLIQNEVTKYRLLDGVSFDPPKCPSRTEKCHTIHPRGLNDLNELYIMAADCEADLSRIMDFLEKMDPSVSQRRLKKRLDVQEQVYEFDDSGSSFPTFIGNILLILSILAVLVLPSLRSLYVKYGLANAHSLLSFFGFNESDIGESEQSMDEEVQQDFLKSAQF